MIINPAGQAAHQTRLLDRLQQRPGWFMLAGFGAGLVIGALTLLGQALLPDSLQRLANSGAMWVIVAFVAGRAARTWRVAAITGFVALIGEILGYYGASFFVVPGEPDWGPYLLVILMWVSAALVAGPFFGWAGFFSRAGQGWLRLAAAGGPGAVFIGEGLALIITLGYWYDGVVCFTIAMAIVAAITWQDAERVKIWLFTLLLGLVFLAGELGLVWIDRLRAGL